MIRRTFFDAGNVLFVDEPMMTERKRWPSALLLDFYGTVVEDDDVLIAEICDEVSRISPLDVTTEGVDSYWRSLFPETFNPSYGAAFRSQRELMRISLRNVLERFDVALDADARCQSLCEYWAHPNIYPESRDVLAECKAPICLVSNIDNAELNAALEHHSLHFNRVVTSEDSRAYKPRPEMFEKALSLLALEPDEVLHIGDSFSCDVRGAKALGIPVLWINRRKKQVPPDGEVPDHVSADLTGLLEILGLRDRGHRGQPMSQ